jgi:chromatin remodeling complex protein RSC6
MKKNNCCKKNLKKKDDIIVSEMPRNSKSTPIATTTTATTTAPESSSAAPKRAKKAAAAAAVTSAVETAPVVESVVAPESSEIVDAIAESVDVSDAAALMKQTSDFLVRVNEVGTLFATLKTEFKLLEKKWSRKLKESEKLQAKRKRKAGNRQPSGFVKPTKISDELAKFLDKPIGTEMARTEVTREINNYINEHSLKCKDNGRIINPDAKLRSLLKLGVGDELTYFNLQTYMAPHFHKSVKASTEKPAVV